jgi:hypothetical protein
MWIIFGTASSHLGLLFYWLEKFSSNNIKTFWTLFILSTLIFTGLIIWFIMAHMLNNRKTIEHVVQESFNKKISEPETITESELLKKVASDPFVRSQGNIKPGPPQISSMDEYSSGFMQPSNLILENLSKDDKNSPFYQGFSGGPGTRQTIKINDDTPLFDDNFSFSSNSRDTIKIDAPVFQQNLSSPIGFSSKETIKIGSFAKEEKLFKEERSSGDLSSDISSKKSIKINLPQKDINAPVSVPSSKSSQKQIQIPVKEEKIQKSVTEQSIPVTRANVKETSISSGSKKESSADKSKGSEPVKELARARTAPLKAMRINLPKKEKKYDKGKDTPSGEFKVDIANNLSRKGSK